MRISDWSSDVCSSDLQAAGVREARAGLAQIGKKPGPDRRHASRRRHRFALHQLEKRCWVEPGAGQDEPLAEHRRDMAEAPAVRMKERHDGHQRLVGVEFEAEADQHRVEQAQPMRIETTLDRKSVVWGKRVSVRVALGGGRSIKKKKKK